MEAKGNAEGAQVEGATVEKKGKAISIIPDSESEYNEIKTAAEATKRSLASFCLYCSLEAARKINSSSAN